MDCTSHNRHNVSSPSFPERFRTRFMNVTTQKDVCTSTYPPRYVLVICQPVKRMMTEHNC